MNAREILNKLIDTESVHPIGNVNIDYKEHSAALRELDQLLTEIADCIKYDCERNNHGPVNKRLRAIELRLAQAGYGEK